MSETAPQPIPEQLPGQSQLFTEEITGIAPDGTEAKRLKEWNTEQGQRWLEAGLSGPNYAERVYSDSAPEPGLSPTENSPDGTKELPMATYESGIARGLGKLAHYFEKGAEKTDSGMEKARRFGRFLGKTATKSQTTLSRTTEGVKSTREKYRQSGETTSQRIGKLVGKALVEMPARGAEKATRHMGGNLSELRQENAQARAGYARTNAEMLARQLANETDPEVRAQTELKIAKLQHKQTIATKKSEVYAARAHKRRTGSAVRSVPTTNAGTTSFETTAAASKAA